MQVYINELSHEQESWGSIYVYDKYIGRSFI